MAGGKSRTWKGGVTPENTKIRNSSFYHAWRRGVFVRDNFTCKTCGTRGGYLEAHHIKKFSELVKEAKANTMLSSSYDACASYFPMWDISLGETLCRICHKKGKHNWRVNA